jgi:hypothetical protein
MPQPLSLPADRLAADGVYRTCRLCSNELPLVPENFYHRVNRATGETTWIDARCQSCRRRHDAQVRAARRQGRGVRARFERKFGVEIECMVNAADLAREMTLRGLSVSQPGYSHRVTSSWKIVTDASVSGGYELVSPPLKGAAGIEQLRLACEALEAAGARVDRRCGLHVHHDVSDLDAPAFGRLFRGWSVNQRNTNGLVAASRRNSQWAHALSNAEVARVEQQTTIDGIRSLYFDRYRSLNVACFPRYGTVEVRQHQGTTNFSKIAAWIGYAQAIIAAAKAGDVPTGSTPEVLIDALAAHGLSTENVETLKARAAHFSGRRQPVAA